MFYINYKSPSKKNEAYLGKKRSTLAKIFYARNTKNAKKGLNFFSKMSDSIFGGVCRKNDKSNHCQVINWKLISHWNWQSITAKNSWHNTKSFEFRVWTRLLFLVNCLQVRFRWIFPALGKWTSQCEYSEVTLARDDRADSRDHQVIHQWSSVWPIWGGNQIWRTNSKWEDWGGGVQWFVLGQLGWPGLGVVVKYPILLFLTIIINTNTLLHAWGFEKIFFCKQDLQASDILPNINIVQPIH